MRHILLSLTLALGLALMLVGLAAVPSFGQSFDGVRELIRRGEFDGALASCETALRRQPRDYRVLALKGIALQGLGRAEESLAAFRQSMRVRPDFLPALQGAAQLEYQLRDPRCRATLEALVRIRPEPTAFAMLGVLAFEANDCAASLKHYAAAGAAAEDPLIRWQRAGCSFQLRRWEEAESLFSGLLAMREDDRVRYNLGLTRVRAGRFREAVAALRPLAERAAADPDAASLLATAHEALKELPEAFEVLKRGINLNPASERLYAELANLCLEHGAIDLGVEVLVIGIGNNPRSARIQTMLGVLHARAGQMEKAEAAFRQAELLGPETAFGRVGLAVAMMEMGAVDEAIARLRDRSGRPVDDPEVDLTLAQALLQKDSSAAELEEAAGLLRRLTTTQPRNPRTWSLLGKLRLRLDRPAEAIAPLETAIRLDPADRNSTYQLMTAYRRLGRMREAAALQSRVAQLLDDEREADVEASRFRLVRAPEGRPGR